jgi:hypothetical protein
MALRAVSRSRAEIEALKARFIIAQDTLPEADLLRAQADIRIHVNALAQFIDETIADGREKSVVLTHLEDALMWAGKAIFKVENAAANGYPQYASRGEGEVLL